jgi:stage IV sporulation protein A
MGTGELTIDIKPADGLFYRIVREETGLEIDGEQRLFAVLKELSGIRSEYLKVEDALAEVRTKGYGVVTPKLEELTWSHLKLSDRELVLESSLGQVLLPYI